jgi:hypothetical protein
MFETKGFDWKDSYGWRISQIMSFILTFTPYLNVPEGGRARVLDVGGSSLTVFELSFGTEN